MPDLYCVKGKLKRRLILTIVSPLALLSVPFIAVGSTMYHVGKDIYFEFAHDRVLKELEEARDIIQLIVEGTKDLWISEDLQVTDKKEND